MLDSPCFCAPSAGAGVSSCFVPSAIPDARLTQQVQGAAASSCTRQSRTANMQIRHAQLERGRMVRRLELATSPRGKL